MNTTNNTSTESYMVSIASSGYVVALAQSVLDNGQDYSPEFDATWGNEGYGLYNRGGDGICLVYDNGSADMNKARIIARVI